MMPKERRAKSLCFMAQMVISLTLQITEEFFILCYGSLKK
jgi:hypothetical protein